MRLLACSLVLLALAPVLAAQPLPDGVLFDDFTYESTTWSPDARKLEPGSLYGPNAWRTGPRRADTTVERAWYRAYWREMDDFYANTQVEVANGHLRIEAQPGTYDASQRHPQVASGFAAVTGTWAARVRFSDLGAVPFYESGRHRGWPRDDIMQSFWTLSPYRIHKGKDWGWSEMDHEFNNWFGRVRRTDSSVRLYLETGYFENGVPHYRPMRARGSKSHKGYTCAATRANRTIDLEAQACSDALLGRWQGTNEPPFALLLIRHDGEHVQFVMRVESEEVRIDMMSPLEVDPVPSQPMMAMFSMYIKDHEDATTFALDTPQAMDTDWFLYAAEALSLDEVVARVDAARAASVARLNTLGRSSAAPYVGCDTLQPWPDWETCPWPRIAPLDSAFVARLYDPPSVSIGCLRDGATWIVRPPLRATNYAIRWQSRYHYRDRGPTRWHRTDRAGFRYTPPSPRGAPYYVELVVDVVDEKPLGGQAATGTIRSMLPVGPQRADSCVAPVDPDPLATAPG